MGKNGQPAITDRCLNTLGSLEWAKFESQRKQSNVRFFWCLLIPASNLARQGGYCIKQDIRKRSFGIVKSGPSY